MTKSPLYLIICSLCAVPVLLFRKYYICRSAAPRLFLSNNFLNPFSFHRGFSVAMRTGVIQWRQHLIKGKVFILLRRTCSSSLPGASRWRSCWRLSKGPHTFIPHCLKECECVSGRSSGLAPAGCRPPVTPPIKLEEAPACPQWPQVPAQQGLHSLVNNGWHSNQTWAKCGAVATCGQSRFYNAACQTSTTKLKRGWIF